MSAIVKKDFFLSFLKGVWLEFGNSYEIIFNAFFPFAYGFTHHASHNSSLCKKQKMAVKNIPHMNIHLYIKSLSLLSC